MADARAILIVTVHMPQRINKSIIRLYILFIFRALHCVSLGRSLVHWMVEWVLSARRNTD